VNTSQKKSDNFEFAACKSKDWLILQEKNESLKVPPAYLEDITGISPHDYAYKLRPNYGGICQQNGFDSR